MGARGARSSWRARAGDICWQMKVRKVRGTAHAIRHTARRQAAGPLPVAVRLVNGVYVWRPLGRALQVAPPLRWPHASGHLQKLLQEGALGCRRRGRGGRWRAQGRRKEKEALMPVGRAGGRLLASQHAEARSGGGWRPPTQSQRLPVVGHRVQQRDRAAGVSDGLLHVVQGGADLLALGIYLLCKECGKKGVWRLASVCGPRPSGRARSAARGEQQAHLSPACERPLWHRCCGQWVRQCSVWEQCATFVCSQPPNPHPAGTDTSTAYAVHVTCMGKSRSTAITGRGTIASSSWHRKSGREAGGWAGGRRGAGGRRREPCFPLSSLAAHSKPQFQRCRCSLLSAISRMPTVVEALHTSSSP